jgi:hypothetical protein
MTEGMRVMRPAYGQRPASATFRQTASGCRGPASLLAGATPGTGRRETR